MIPKTRQITTELRIANLRYAEIAALGWSRDRWQSTAWPIEIHSQRGQRPITMHNLVRLRSSHAFVQFFQLTSGVGELFRESSSSSSHGDFQLVFPSPEGVCVLDDGQICEFRNTYSTPNGWPWRIICGGWLALESQDDGFYLTDVMPTELHEYLVVGDQCVFVLTQYPPKFVANDSTDRPVAQHVLRMGLQLIFDLWQCPMPLVQFRFTQSHSLRSRR